MKLEFLDTVVELKAIRKTMYTEGNLAVQADVLWEDDNHPETITFSVNVPTVRLGEGEFLAKNYSEGEPLYSALIGAGLIEPTGQEVPSGWVVLPVCRLTEKANDFIQ